MLIVILTEDGEEGYPGNLNAFAKYSLSATSGDLRCQFHQRFMCAFFVQKFVQSQNVTRKKAFVHKISSFNVDDIDHRCQTSITIFLEECYKKRDRFTKEALSVFLLPK
jgi:hypothetical protein